MPTASAALRSVKRRWRSPTLPTQAFLLMTASLAIVAGGLIWHQGESIRQKVLEERLAAVSRQVQTHVAAIAAAGIGDDRAAIARYLGGEMDEMMAELGAFETLVTDESGVILAANDEAVVGDFEPADEVRVILSGEADSVMRPELGDELLDFSFALPIVLPAFSGAVLVEEDIQALNGRIAEATWESTLPALLALLVLGPLAGVIARRVLTRTQRTEQEASQDRFKSLVQSASDVILVVDPNGVIRYATPATRRVLGQTPEEIQETVVIDIIHPADLDTARSALNSTAEMPGCTTHAEYRMRHADGRWLFADVHATNLQADPSVRGTVLTIRDVSEVKELEAQLTH